MIVLGIESSCDETAVAVLDGKRVRASAVASQDEVHARFGGVVPELASRKHLETIIPLVRFVLDKANLTMNDVGGVAVTNAPGLIGALLVGLSAAKGIAYALDVPIVGVNHLEGHLNAVHLETDAVPYPHVGLVVSGGHTSLYLVRSFGDYELLGATRDDAAGEAYDKVAKLMDLGYPGGPAIDRLAGTGDEKAYSFTKPKFDGDTLDFSFSGIKTAVMLEARKAQAEHRFNDDFKRNMAASFQRAVVNILCDRLFEAAARENAEAVVVSGGVAANSGLRKELERRAKTASIPCFIPAIRLCTDNASMIAYVGARHLADGERSDLTLNAVANQEIGV
jgi:N6-L-threonylcarbamoyladenine synthase